MITTSRRRGARGVTLIELMVALVVSAIVLTAILAVVQSQQRAYFQGHLQRAAQGSARQALGFIEQRLALAGYGMDAPLAFDFDRYPALPCPPLAAGCPRDSVDGNDELVFYERNSRYWVPEDATAEPRGNAWRITALSGNTLTVNARLGDVFLKGQILQAVCKAAKRYVYMTVAGKAGPITADGSLSIPLLSTVTSDPFRRQDQADAAVESCFTNGEARLYLIDRYRFHVRPVQANGVQPYLVLDRGLDANEDGPDEAEEVVIAEGIESFQVGYVMTNADLDPRGTIPGTLITFTPGATGATSGDGITTLVFPGTVDPALSVYRPTSWYGYTIGPPPATQRNTDHQANIRAVRIGLSARGPDPEPGPQRADPFVPLLNQNARPAWIPANVPYSRARVETTVLVRNMAARAMNDF